MHSKFVLHFSASSCIISMCKCIHTRRMNMPKYSILLFDADQTLLDFKRSEHEAVSDCLKYYSVPVNDETINNYSEINSMYWKMLERGEIEKKKLYSARWQAFADKYGYSIDAEKISQLYLESLATKAYVLPGAEEICQKLSKHCRLYIITNGNKKVQQGRMGKVALSKYFLDIFISEDIGYEKPDIQYFNAVTSRIPDFDASKALVIGDSLTSDIQGGINAKIDTCWFNPHKKSAPCNMNINYTITDLSELEDIVL